MSEFEEFKAAIERVCEEHGFMLCATGYDHVVARKKGENDPNVYGDLEEADW
jgi:hypothetical protein